METRHLSCRLIAIGLVLSFYICSFAQIHVTIDDPEYWTVSNLAPYVGERVIFDTPLIVTSNYNTLYVSPRRIFSATNQCIPMSDEYNMLLALNAEGSIQLTGVSGYHRMGEKIYNLEADVLMGSLKMISGEWRGNTRADLETTLPDIDQRGKHDLLICGMNLEYYLVEQFSSPGPRDSYEHQKQRAKVSKALAKINADIYGLVEIQQGDNAMREIAEDLTENTGRPFSFIPDKSGASGTYTKSSFVYCTDKVEPVGAIQEIESGVSNRKKMQAFRELATGEMFIYSINHFKAKSGNGSGPDADQGDGQGGYNATRVGEANAVINKYNKFKTSIGDEDILIMGDLNAYGKEDPITTFTKQQFTDLHRYFHADSSYSYTYRSEAGYLDHALCNASMLPQITGMNAFHINSDENDKYTYDKSDDRTMFRCSDHDPVLVGIKLNKELKPDTSMAVVYSEQEIYIRNAVSPNTPSYYRIYSTSGHLLLQANITSDIEYIEKPFLSGIYVLIIYYNGRVYREKIYIP